MRLLRGDNVIQGRTRWDGVKRWSTAHLDEHRGYLLQPGDVVLAMDRPWIEAGLKHATLTEADCPSLLVQRVARLRARPGLNQRFLGYVIQSSDFSDYIVRVQTGTAVPHVSSAQIKSYSFLLPSIHQQIGAASLLGTLDDKINLNRSMAQTLEATAQALFKSWFVDFDPVHARAERRPTGLPDDLAALFPDSFGADGIPIGWKREPLLQHAQVISGGTPKTEQPAYWGGPILWASAKDVSQCPGRFLVETERTITPRGVQESATQIVPRLSTVVVARGATTGRHCILGRDMAMNQSCYALTSPGQTPYWMSCAFAEVVGSLLQAAHGSVFDTITIATLTMAQVMAATESVKASFEDAVAPLFDRILLLIEESASLQQLRDTLLPKLISGEFRMADAEQRVAAA